MCAHLKCNAQTLSPNNSDRDGTLICRRCAQTFEHFGGSLGVLAIHDDGFKSLASQITNGSFSVPAVLYGYFQVAEDSA